MKIEEGQVQKSYQNSLGQMKRIKMFNNRFTTEVDILSHLNINSTVLKTLTNASYVFILVQTKQFMNLDFIVIKSPIKLFAEDFFIFIIFAWDNTS
jgi:hypothetical protein